jgi:hypothetical protein
MLSRAIETLGRRAGIISARKNAGMAIAARPPPLRGLNPVELDTPDRDSPAVGWSAIRLPACGLELKLRAGCQLFEVDTARGVKVQCNQTRVGHVPSPGHLAGAGANTRKGMAFQLDPSRTRKPTRPRGPALHLLSANIQSTRINRQ